MTLNSEDIKIYERIKDDKIDDYNSNLCYVLGKNPTITNEQKKKTPDNRIPVPLAKSAVDDMTGFACSVGSITIDFQGDDEEYKEINKDIYSHNESDIETTELYNQSLTQGEAYELFWVSDELGLSNGIVTPEFCMVDNKEIVLVWSDNMKPELKAAIRFWSSDDKVKYADVYYPGVMESWVFDKNNNYNYWVRDEERDTVYPYKDVPIAIYKINRHSQPLFEAEKEMIDAHDKLISKSVNEIDRFNALIALFPDSVDAEFIRKLEEYKVIDGLGEYDHWPEYLEKNLAKIEAFYSGLADRLERLYHKTIKIPDFSDEQFSGNSSGVAISYKLMGMEFRAAQIEAYFNAGLKQRNKLINQVLNSGTRKWDNYELIIKSERNIPVDEKNKIEMAEKLASLVSKETLLKFLPKNIIDNIEDELNKLQDVQNEANKIDDKSIVNTEE